MSPSLVSAEPAPSHALRHDAPKQGPICHAVAFSSLFACRNLVFSSILRAILHTTDIGQRPALACGIAKRDPIARRGPAHPRDGIRPGVRISKTALPTIPSFTMFSTDGIPRRPGISPPHRIRRQALAQKYADPIPLHFADPGRLAQFCAPPPQQKAAPLFQFRL